MQPCARPQTHAARANFTLERNLERSNRITFKSSDSPRKSLMRLFKNLFNPPPRPGISVNSTLAFVICHAILNSSRQVFLCSFIGVTDEMWTNHSGHVVIMRSAVLAVEAKA